MLEHLWKSAGAPRYVVAGFCLFVVSSFMGCNDNDNGLETVVVHGTVKYDGEPIEQGSIEFFPTGSTKGQVTMAIIKDGEYRVEGTKGGVPVGDQIVRIQGLRFAKNATARDRAENNRVPYLPAKYNTKSELTLTLESEQGELLKDYDLAK